MKPTVSLVLVLILFVLVLLFVPTDYVWSEGFEGMVDGKPKPSSIVGLSLTRGSETDLIPKTALLPCVCSQQQACPAHGTGYSEEDIKQQYANTRTFTPTLGTYA